MRLIHFLTLRLCVVASVLMCAWAVLFYFAILNEINDEQDDALEDYAELVMRRFLRGEQLPDKNSGSNNQYYLRSVSQQYAATHPHVRYADHEVLLEYKNEYEPARSIYYIFSTDDGQQYEIGVSVPTIDKADLIEALLWLIALLCGGIVVVFALISLFTVKRTMRPLHRMLAWMNAYKPGQKNSSFDVDSNILEFRQLGNTVEQLTHRSEHYEQQQQLFISNASHEMQTPLAICMGRLEAMLEEGSLGEHEGEEIGKALQALGGLSQLNKSLLMLSRIDNGQYADDKPTNLVDILQHHLPDYQDLFGGKGIVVDFRAAHPFVISADEHLARMLVLNLLKNAFVHTAAGGRISIACNGRELRLCNTASGGALDKEKIFLPFYHSANSRKSMGLGLPLAQAVCRRYALHLEYSFAQGMHCFAIAR